MCGCVGACIHMTYELVYVCGKEQHWEILGTECIASFRILSVLGISKHVGGTYDTVLLVLPTLARIPVVRGPYYWYIKQMCGYGIGRSI